MSERMDHSLSGRVAASFSSGLHAPTSRTLLTAASMCAPEFEGIYVAEVVAAGIPMGWVRVPFTAEQVESLNGFQAVVRSRRSPVVTTCVRVSSLP